MIRIHIHKITMVYFIFAPKEGHIYRNYDTTYGTTYGTMDAYDDTEPILAVFALGMAVILLATLL